MEQDDREEKFLQLMDGDSGDTFSVDSSITQYRVENGRRYHAYKDGTYWLVVSASSFLNLTNNPRAPNDEKQNENLDIRYLFTPIPKSTI